MASSAGAVWRKGGETRAVVLQWPRFSLGGAFHWMHMCSLFLLLSVVGAAAMVLVDGLAFGASLSRLPGLLHWWVPSILTIVAAAMPIRRLTPARVLLLVALGAVFLVAFDLMAEALQSQPVTRWALVGGESVLMEVTTKNVQPESWVTSLWAWVSGALTGVSEGLPRYPVGHPRVLVAQSLAEASTVFLTVGIVGIVLTLRRWVDESVALRNPSNDIVVGAVLGWILAPSLSVLATTLTGSRLSGVLFRGEPLLAVLIPCIAIAALGVLGLFYALRGAR